MPPKKYEPTHEIVKDLKLSGSIAQLLDSAIDHIGKTLDNTGLRDWAWLSAWIMGSIAIYQFLLALKKTGAETSAKADEVIADIQQKAPAYALLLQTLTDMPFPFGFVAQFAMGSTQETVEKYKDVKSLEDLWAKLQQGGK